MEYAYTAWFFTRYGEGKKTFWGYSKPRSIQEVKEEIAQKYPGATDILVWQSNWFGMAPDNKPEPDERYGIKETRDANS